MRENRLRYRSRHRAVRGLPVIGHLQVLLINSGWAHSSPRRTDRKKFDTENRPRCAQAVLAANALFVTD